MIEEKIDPEKMLIANRLKKVIDRLKKTIEELEPETNKGE